MNFDNNGSSPNGDGLSFVFRLDVYKNEYLFIYKSAMKTKQIVCFIKRDDGCSMLNALKKWNKMIAWQWLRPKSFRLTGKRRF